MSTTEDAAPLAPTHDEDRSSSLLEPQDLPADSSEPGTASASIRRLLRFKQSMKRHLRTVLQEEQISAASLEPRDIEKLHLYSDVNEGTCRHRVEKQLHSLPVAITIVVLVLLDCCFVIGELYLDLSVVIEGANKCHALEQGHGLNHTEFNHTQPSGLVNETLHDAHAHDAHGVHDIREHVSHYFHIGSMTILSMFVVEISVRLIVMGCRRFVKSKVEVIDAVVVIVSLLLDLVIMFEKHNLNLVGFLSIMLLWRFFRIVNTLLATYKRRVKLRYDLQRLARKNAESRLEESNSKLRHAQEHIRRLEELALQHGASLSAINSCRAADPKPRATNTFLAQAMGSMLNTLGMASPLKVTPVPQRKRKSLLPAVMVQPRHSVTCAENKARLEEQPRPPTSPAEPSSETSNCSTLQIQLNDSATETSSLDEDGYCTPVEVDPDDLLGSRRLLSRRKTSDKQQNHRFSQSQESMFHSAAESTEDLTFKNQQGFKDLEAEEDATDNSYAPLSGAQQRVHFENSAFADGQQTNTRDSKSKQNGALHMTSFANDIANDCSKVPLIRVQSD